MGDDERVLLSVRISRTINKCQSCNGLFIFICYQQQPVDLVLANTPHTSLWRNHFISILPSYPNSMITVWHHSHTQKYFAERFPSSGCNANPLHSKTSDLLCVMITHESWWQQDQNGLILKTQEILSDQGVANCLCSAMNLFGAYRFKKCVMML